MTWDSIQQLIRILAQFAAGFLVNAGLITGDMQTALVGAVTSLAGIGWWLFWLRKQPGATPPAL